MRDRRPHVAQHSSLHNPNRLRPRVRVPVPNRSTLPRRHPHYSKGMSSSLFPTPATNTVPPNRTASIAALIDDSAAVQWQRGDA